MITLMARRRRSSHNLIVIVCCFSVLVHQLKAQTLFNGVTPLTLSDPVKRFDFSVSASIDSYKRTYSSTEVERQKGKADKIIVQVGLIMSLITR